jgi:hypothetical protein
MHWEAEITTTLACRHAQCRRDFHRCRSIAMQHRQEAAIQATQVAMDEDDLGGGEE